LIKITSRWFLEKYLHHRKLTMNLKILFLLVTLSITLLSVPTTIPNTTAQAQGGIGDGIDLIILIDQSGSMTTGDDNVRPTDPEGLRLDAARYLIEYMAFDNNSVNPDRVNRVTVVGFAGWAEVLVYPTTLDSSENMKRAQNQIRQQNLGGGTNFLAGLQMIREEIFPRATDVELENDLRRRIIVIITDGSPFYAEAEQANYTQRQYFDEIEDYYLQQFGRERYPLYIVGIDQFNFYWRSAEPFWNTIASPNPLDSTMTRAFRAVNSEEITTKIISFLCPFLGQTGTDRDCRVVELGQHFVEPYAHTVRFSFFKNQQDSQIELSRPLSQGGVAVRENDPDVTFIPHNIRTESYEIEFPEPGCWSTTKRGEGRVDVLTDISFKNFLELRQPAITHSQLIPLELVFEAKDNNGFPITERNGYPVRFEASLQDPNGNIQPIVVAKKAGADGTYVSTNSLQAIVPGEYEVAIKGFVDINPANFACLEENEGGARQLFDKTFVFDVIAPDIQVNYPNRAHFLYTPLDKLILTAIDDQGKEILLSETQPWVLETAIESPSGVDLFITEPKWVNGYYEIYGPFFLNEAGTYKVKLTAKIDGRIFYEQAALFKTAEDIVLLAPQAELPILTPVLTTTVQLQDNNEQPAASNPAFPLRVEAALLDTEGNQLNLTELSVITDTVSGRYQAVTPWILETAGFYTIQITGYLSSQAATGQFEQVAFLKEFPIQGSNDLPRIEVIKPAQSNSSEENRHALHGGWAEWFRETPMQVRVQLLKGQLPVSPSDVFQGDVSNLITINVEDIQGNAILTNLPLAESNSDQVGLLTAELVGLNEVGKYKVKVQLNSEKLIDGRKYKGIVPEIVVPFELMETNLYRTVRITVIIFLSLLAIVLLTILGFIIWNFLPPYPRGVLIAQTTGFGNKKVLSEFCINCKGLKRKRIVFKGKETKHLRLKMIKVWRISPVKSSAEKKRVSVLSQKQTQPEEVIKIEAISQDTGKIVASGTLSGTRKRPVACTQRAIDPNDGDVRYEFEYKQ
jgi:hypothetical protein